MNVQRFDFQKDGRKGSLTDPENNMQTDDSNYKIIEEILVRLTKLCVSESPSGKTARKHEQRLLRNMGAHSVVLELLQIPYEKVNI